MDNSEVANKYQRGKNDDQLRSKLISQIKNVIKEEERENIKLAITHGSKLYLIRAVLAKGTPLASIRAFKVMQKLDENGEVIATIPDGPEILKSSFKGEIIILAACSRIENIEEIFKDEADVEELFYTEVDVHELEIPFQEMEIKEEKQHSEIEHLIRKVETILQKRKSLASPTDILDKLKTREIKIRARDLDKLFILVGELVLIRNKLFMASRGQDSHVMRDALTALDQTTNKLYSKILEMRLIPVKQIFNLSSRFVQEFSEKLGKQVDLVIDDRDEVTLDRSIVEELTDPLISIIRNALDHGIELPEERRAAGKPSVGTLKLSAKREKELAIITVEDDGRGIDTDLIRKTAIKKGLLPQSTVEKLSDQEALQLVCLPGFSTKKLTSLTGEMDMGLNAIKQRVEAIGGYLKIESKKGEGTRITLSVPVTKAIVSVITVLLVGIKGEVYAIPSSMVHSIVKFKESLVKHVEGGRVIVYRGKIIPVYSLSSLLGLSYDHENHLVILQKGVGLCGLSVSSILGFEDVAVRSEKILPGKTWILGATILSNEKVALIIDPWALLVRKH